MKRLKRIIDGQLLSSSELPICSHPGCLRTTFSQKRFCSEHVCETRYAQNLAKQMDQRKKELIALNKQDDMPIDAHFVREALAVLWEERDITAPGLCRILGLSHHQARHLLKEVAKHGLATIYENKRKKLCARAILPQEDGLD
jgi:hypothetical protein